MGRLFLWLDFGIAEMSIQRRNQLLLSIGQRQQHTLDFRASCSQQRSLFTWAAAD